MIQRVLEIKEDLHTIISLDKTIGNIWLNEYEWKKIEVSIFFLNLLFIVY